MMIHPKIIFRILGSLLFIEAALMILSLGVAIYFRDDIFPFLITIFIAIVLGIILKYAGHGSVNSMSRRDGYIVVSLSWILFSIIGMLPFLISGYIPNVTNAFFETMSGFTTTGASILNNIEEFPHGLLFWRSLTQWIGGLGIVFFTIAILPSFGLGDVKLFAAEATGPMHDRLHSRIGITAKWLWAVYLTLTLACAGVLFLEGMNIFDSFCHALTCIATGGYSTKQDSIAAFNSPTIEYTLTGFMLLAGTNFTLLYLLLTRFNIKKLFHDTEFKWYIGFLLLFTLIITISLFLGNQNSIEEAFRKAVFQVVSIQTTTGYITTDYMLWPSALLPIILMIMYIGSSSGSTSGGMKCIRVVMLVKSIRNEFKRILHPNAVIPIRVNHTVVSTSVRSTLIAFSCLYIVILILSWIIFMCLGLGFMEGISIAMSSISNVGPAMGKYGPTSSWSALPDAEIGRASCRERVYVLG